MSLSLSTAFKKAAIVYATGANVTIEGNDAVLRNVDSQAAQKAVLGLLDKAVIEDGAVTGFRRTYLRRYDDVIHDVSFIDTKGRLVDVRFNGKEKQLSVSLDIVDGEVARRKLESGTSSECRSMFLCFSSGKERESAEAGIEVLRNLPTPTVEDAYDNVKNAEYRSRIREKLDLAATRVSQSGIADSLTPVEINNALCRITGRNLKVMDETCASGISGMPVPEKLTLKSKPA